MACLIQFLDIWIFPLCCTLNVLWNHGVPFGTVWTSFRLKCLTKLFKFPLQNQFGTGAHILCNALLLIINSFWGLNFNFTIQIHQAAEEQILSSYLRSQVGLRNTLEQS